MNSKTILNVAAFAMMVIGLLLKANHLAGADISIILSVAIMLYTIFIYALKDNKEAGITDRMNYFLTGVLAFWIIEALFKFEHWAGSSILVNLGYSFALILPIIFFIQKGNFKISKQFFITFSIFFIFVLGIFPNNALKQFSSNGQYNTIVAKTATAMNSATTKTETSDSK